MLFPALLARAAAAPYGNRRSPLEDFAGCRPGLWLRGRLCISGRSLALVGNTVLEPCFSPAARCAVFIAKTSRSASAAMERW